jgi:two-component system chemotaxis response regulator CheB
MNPRKGQTRKSGSGGSVKTEKPNAEEPGTDALRTGELGGPPSPFTCPDCGGSLWEIKEPGLVRYRCHVGHGFTADSLRDGMEEKLEETLWSALRAIEEGIALRKRMNVRAQTQRLKAFAANLDDEISELERRADALRQLLLNPRNSTAAHVQGSRKRLKHA